MEFINTYANLGQCGIDGAICTGNNNVFFDSPEFSDGSEWFSKGSQILGPPHFNDPNQRNQDITTLWDQ